MPGQDDPLTALTGRQMPSSFDENHEFYNEKALSKVFRKLKEEPLVPLGAGLTVFAFVSAYRALRRGDSQTANRMFRARVAAQGFTVFAMVAGGMYYNKDREATKELRKLKEAKDNEEKRLKWIRELEVRDEEEKAMKAMFRDRKAKVEANKANVAAGSEDKDGSSGGVIGALGMSGWGKQGDSQAEASGSESAGGTGAPQSTSFSQETPEKKS